MFTAAGKLAYRGIIHVAGIDGLWRASERSIRCSVRSAVALAQRHGARSLAFPIIGSGSGGFSQERALALMQDELAKMSGDLAVIIVEYAKRPH